jgi:Domain of unknown function (DUF397)
MGETRTARIRWRKSSYSGGDNNCVEIAATGANVAVRDSKDLGGGALSFSRDAWQAFTAGVRRLSGPL